MALAGGEVLMPDRSNFPAPNSLASLAALAVKGMIQCIQQTTLATKKRFVMNMVLVLWAKDPGQETAIYWIWLVAGACGVSMDPRVTQNVFLEELAVLNCVNGDNLVGSRCSADHTVARVVLDDDGRTSLGICLNGFGEDVHV
jgi:hypothetical protein